jgi:opacity protein-like surface antigen
MKMRIAIFALLAGLGAHAAQAADAASWYVGAALGRNAVSDVEWTRTTSVTGGGSAQVTLRAEFESDISYAASVGYRLNETFSFEAEYAHRANTSSSIFNPAGGALGDQAKIGADSLMLNALYSFAAFGGVRPFVGVGLGASRLDVSVQDGLGAASDTSWAFSYQAIVGAKMALGDRWVLVGQYQYFGVPDPGVAAITRNAAGTVSNVWKPDEFAAQTISLGVQLGF